MKRSLIRMTVLLALMTLQASASGWATGDGSVYHKGDRLGSAGISFFFPGVLAAFDYGLHDCFSAGAATGYNVYSFSPQTLTHHWPVMARVAFHPFNLKVLADKIIIRNIIDFYAGVSGGWIFRWDTYDFNIASKPDDHPSSFGVREYIGMRYYFKDNLALFIEDCGDISTISAGVTLLF